MKTEHRSSAIQYAKALLQLTEADGSDEDVYKNLLVVSRAFQEEPQFEMLFRHPSITAPEKKRFLSLFAGSLDRLSAGLLLMLCEKRRMQLLPYIVEEFYELLRAKHNIVSARLVSAAPPSDEAVLLIKRKLIGQMKKHVELLVETDESLLGGFVLKIGDQVIDGSLKGRLQSIKNALLSV
jgi:F-type H+-transporting ATPase subunit delta